MLSIFSGFEYSESTLKMSEHQLFSNMNIVYIAPFNLKESLHG